MYDYIIYTDGGCLGNRRDDGCLGGYGYVVLNSERVLLSEGGGKRKNVTNNIMEMTAVIESLKELANIMDSELEFIEKDKCACLLRSDSKYVIDNYEDYIKEWKSNGWRKKNGKPVLNRELWMRIDNLTRGFKLFEFEWVKGHSGDHYNEMVDAIATQYMKAKIHPQ